jgi:hypothetical protein
VFSRIFIPAWAVLLSVAAPLVAQINDGAIKPENINLLPMERPIAEYVLLVVFLLAAMGLGFFTSKRTST